MRLIAVEANISAGKSTLLPKLAEAIGYTQIQEPVDDPEFLRLLGEFTKNPTDTKKRLKFQKYITERRANLLKGIPDGSYLIERSLFSDLVFSQANMLSMERPDACYLDYYYDIKRRLVDYPQVDCIVYLKTTPEVVYGRLQQRGRPEEAGTPLEYLKDLHRFHNACLPQICREYKTKLITVDWDDYGECIGGVDGLVRLLKKEGVL
ncbi:deoxynucleoside kinase [Aeromonas phage vB_AsaP_MQM1]|nr:deoxynucleoside kinase [Aeromonas phage vB_AsaP_MQM1]